ncbi:unnamed protein product [Protopolystoma xenopodis]|uniref:Uncharacterized protein n=1 Tax=Protopolystoma xenopodis TaxID=117903 RepID=A0A3S5CNU0_9PLAT|nr:unnamed protein product [Protopolystoma xenopodis]
MVVPFAVGMIPNEPAADRHVQQDSNGVNRGKCMSLDHCPNATSQTPADMYTRKPMGAYHRRPHLRPQQQDRQSRLAAAEARKLAVFYWGSVINADTWRTC